MSIVFEEIVAEVSPPPPEEPERGPAAPPADREGQRLTLRSDLETFARRAARLHAD